MPMARMFWRMATMGFLEGPLVADLSQPHQLIPAIPWFRQLSENRHDRTVPFAVVATIEKQSLTMWWPSGASCFEAQRPSGAAGWPAGGYLRETGTT